MSSATTAAAPKPARVPSHVLPGLMRGAILRRPIRGPHDVRRDVGRPGRDEREQQPRPGAIQASRESVAVRKPEVDQEAEAESAIDRAGQREHRADDAGIRRPRAASARKTTIATTPNDVRTRRYDERAATVESCDRVHRDEAQHEQTPTSHG